MNDSPVFVIDSDIEDLEFLEDAWKELDFSNELYFFKTAEEALHQLETNRQVPFLIISEINLPKVSGLELKKYLLSHKEMNFKSIPFVFLTSDPSQVQVEQAYTLCTNGVFKKSDTMDKLKQQLADITRYWRESLVPSN